MARTPDQEEERAARIDQLLEELRLNTEDLHELAKQAVERARKARGSVQQTVAATRADRAVRKGRKKR